MSDAGDLKQRFATVRIRTSKDAELAALVKRCAWGAAHALGEQIGISISRGVVVDLQARRVRP